MSAARKSSEERLAERLRKTERELALARDALHKLADDLLNLGSLHCFSLVSDVTLIAERPEVEAATVVEDAMIALRSRLAEFGKFHAEVARSATLAAGPKPVKKESGKRPIH